MILKAFLEKNDVPFDLSFVGKESGRKLPALEGCRYKVHGMGHAEVSHSKRKISIFGDSGDYLMTPDFEHIKIIKSIETYWTFILEGAGV